MWRLLSILVLATAQVFLNAAASLPPAQACETQIVDDVAACCCCPDCGSADIAGPVAACQCCAGTSLPTPAAPTPADRQNGLAGVLLALELADSWTMPLPAVTRVTPRPGVQISSASGPTAQQLLCTWRV